MNSPDNNRNLMKKQDCACDSEHMLSCPNDKGRINTQVPGTQDLNNMLQGIDLAGSLAMVRIVTPVDRNDGWGLSVEGKGWLLKQKCGLLLKQNAKCELRKPKIKVVCSMGRQILGN